MDVNLSPETVLEEGAEHSLQHVGLCQKETVNELKYEALAGLAAGQAGVQWGVSGAACRGPAV